MLSTPQGGSVRVAPVLTRRGGWQRATSSTLFVVFTSPRTGSSWLIDLLDSHPRIAAYAELFLPGDRTTPDYGSRDIPRFEATLAERRRITLMPHRLAYLRRLVRPRPDSDAVGFKLMYGHPHVHPGLLPYLSARRARAVHLVRENALDQIVSWETSVARGLFRAHGTDHVADIAVRIDTTALVTRIEEMERAVAAARATLRRYRIPRLEVTYKQLATEPAKELARIVASLDVEPSEWQVESSLVRMNRRPRGELIENMDEVQAALAGTRFAWMLD
ncbi:MAG: sulfotransferase [Thermoleophilia bacterium]|nr:sulfotransferase [Thermoleophilia bacterium]